MLRCTYFRIKALDIEKFGVDHFLLILLPLSLYLDLIVLFLTIDILLLLRLFLKMRVLLGWLHKKGLSRVPFTHDPYMTVFLLLCL